MDILENKVQTENLTKKHSGRKSEEMTGGRESMTTAMKTPFLSVSTCCVFTVVSAIIIMCFVFLSGRVLFYINDDVAIQSILSGALTGNPNPYVYFVNIIVCTPIAALYSVAPNVPWWFLFLELCVFSSIVLFEYGFLRTISSFGSRTLKRDALIRFAIVVLCAACFFYYPAIRPSFTLAAACLTSSACAANLYCLFQKNAAPIERISISLVSIALIVLAYCLRTDAGIIGMGIYGLESIIAFVLSGFNGTPFCFRKAGSALLTLSLLFFAVFACYMVQHFAYSSDDWLEFDKTNSARAAFMDYRHDSYEENPALFDSVGWDESLTELVSSWFFMDERVNGMAFSKLVDQSSVDRSQSIVESFFTQTLAFEGIAFNAYFALYLALLIAWVLYCPGIVDKVLMASLFVIIPFAGFVYLATIGRFIARAALCVIWPASLSLLLAIALFSAPFCLHAKACNSGFCISPARIIGSLIIVFFTITVVGVVYAQTGKNRVFVYLILCAPVLFAIILGRRSIANPNSARLAFFAAIVLVFFITGAFSYRDVSKSESSITNDNTLYSMLANYADQRTEETIIVPATFNSLDPFQSYPSNVTSWGGWTYYAPWNMHLLSSALLADNVFFVSDDSSHALLLIDYLNILQSGEVTCEGSAIEGTNLIAYKFKRKNVE